MNHTGLRRMLAALAFLFGGFAAELANPVNCQLLHQPSARHGQRRSRQAP